MHQLLVLGSAFGAGMVNSVAGGGTLLWFPTLIWLRAGAGLARLVKAL